MTLIQFSITRDFFLSSIDHLPDNKGVSLLVTNRYLDITNFYAGVHCRIPVYTIHQGQIFIPRKSWRKILSCIRQARELVVDITAYKDAVIVKSGGSQESVAIGEADLFN